MHDVRVGFVLEHRERIGDVKLVQRELMKLLLNETPRKCGQQNKEIILIISSHIESADKRLSELHLESPVISEIKNTLGNIK